MTEQYDEFHMYDPENYFPGDLGKQKQFAEDIEIMGVWGMWFSEVYSKIFVEEDWRPTRKELPPRIQDLDVVEAARVRLINSGIPRRENPKHDKALRGTNVWTVQILSGDRWDEEVVAAENQQADDKAKSTKEAYDKIVGARNDCENCGRAMRPEEVICAMCGHGGVTSPA